SVSGAGCFSFVGIGPTLPLRLGGRQTPFPRRKIGRALVARNNPKDLPLVHSDRIEGAGGCKSCVSISASRKRRQKLRSERRELHPPEGAARKQAALQYILEAWEGAGNAGVGRGGV